MGMPGVKGEKGERRAGWDDGTESFADEARVTRQSGVGLPSFLLRSMCLAEARKNSGNHERGYTGKAIG